MPTPSRAQSDAILDLLPSPVFRLDREGKHTYANTAAARAIGRELSLIIGRTPGEAGIPHHLAVGIEEHVRSVVATGEPTEYQVAAPTPAGTVVFLTRLVPEFAPDGTVTGVIGIGTDVTAQATAKQALRESQERYRSLLEDQTEVVCRFMADGRFTFVNAVYCRVFGKRAEELLGHRWQPQVLPEDVAHVETLLTTMTPANPVVVIENRVLDGAGRVRWMEFVNRGFYNPDGTLRELQAVGRDITDRRAAEDARREAEEARRAAEEATRAEAEHSKYERQLLQSQKLESLGVLAGGIAHDFNNLLTVILGNASLARMGLPVGAPCTTELEHIEKASHRAAELCQQMLAYAGRGQFRIQPINLNQLVQDIAELLAASISKKAVLRFNLTGTLPEVTGDPTQIRQIVMNLITNASDAIAERSGLITLTSGVLDADEKYLDELKLIAALPSGAYVYLEVSDTGAGMTDEVKAKIFEPFFTTKFTGRGLGLAAVQGIIRSHKGAIKVYSQPGRGTTFKVLLPATSATASSAAPRPAPTAIKGDGRWVLVVDDEEDIRVTTRKILERNGFQVELAIDGVAGVEAFTRRPRDFSLVILDLTMPRMGGADAYRQLRRVDPDVRVLLTSGYAPEEATTGFEGKGLAGFVRKPFVLADLLSAVFAAVGP